MKLEGVRTGKVGNVSMSQHELTVEVSRLANVLRAVGTRCEDWLAATKLATPAGEAPPLPPPEMMTVLAWYSGGVLGLLKEQRMRAALTPARGALPMSEEEFEVACIAELEEIKKRKAEVAKSKAIDVAAEPDLFDFTQGDK